MKTTIRVYTDGASRGNPGPGGWAAIVIRGDVVEELAGAHKPATNNQMELEACIQGLAASKKKWMSEAVELHADSRYVLNGIEKWLDGWVGKGWMTVTKTAVENKAQWQKVLALRNHFGKQLKLTKVDGHSGHVYNDRCDELAVQAALGKKPKLFSGSIRAYETFLRENPPKSIKKSEKKSPSSKGTAYSYVSLVGGKVYADKDWTTCERRVKGKNAKYKKVFSKAEETELIQEYTLQALL